MSYFKKKYSEALKRATIVEIGSTLQDDFNEINKYFDDLEKITTSNTIDDKDFLNFFN